jgi:uroporphyrinogen III methyltransferase / synthase
MKVYLVGAGPGDPGLLTLKGRDLLARADVILHDHLASDAILAFARPTAERIYVGKKKADHSMPQEEIARLMIGHARAGHLVVRLKGGDPLVFGRGGEEMEALVEAGIPYEIVPGVTAALGIAAYSGVPLTHREHTSAVTFVTGHNPEQIDWSRIGHAETLVVYMGLTAIGEISARLIAAGRSPSTPAMAVRWGTRPNQQTIVATLADLPAQVAAAQMRPPASVIIGEVVRLREKLNWFEKLPLFGQRILTTRAGMAEPLRELGAEVLEMPTIEIRPPRDPAPLMAAIAELASYDWVIFTSANGVFHFLSALDASPVDLRALRGRLCAVGPATASALADLHLKVDVIPEAYVAEGLLEALRPFPLQGQRVLLPRAAVARDVVPDALRACGAQVDIVEAYQTVIPATDLSGVDPVDWVTFTSSSSVKNFLALGGGRLLHAGARIASIGPATSATVVQHGYPVAVEARAFTIPGLVQAMVDHQ